ncbi:Vps62-related protein [Hyalangium versicolor]|uniref:Vps62-related protein n=1 Tax=Hyalangium versicolor TaxID=2861190 RepID=UPI001CCD2D9F|nr:Vps62-related protein [Hyalangium versicolor]
MPQSLFIGQRISFTSHHGTLLGARPDGSLYAINESVGTATTWSVQDAGNGLVYLVSANNTQLGSRQDGSVYTHSNRAEWERWRLEPQANGRVLITSAQFGLHLGVAPEGRFYTHSNTAEWEQWIARDALVGSSIVLFNTTHQRRLVAAPDGNVSSNTAHEYSERWAVEDAGNGRVYLVDVNRKQLGSRADGTVYTHTNRLEWERWKIEPRANGVFLITSAEFGLHLGVNGNGGLYTHANSAEWEQWVLEGGPRTPGISSITADNITALLQRYAPIVYFHPDEQFFMCSVDWFLRQASLYDRTTRSTTPAGSLPAVLPTVNGGEDRYYLTTPSSARAGNLESAEALVNAKYHRDAGFLDLQFWFFYAYNGAGTAKVELLVGAVNSDVSLTPMGEHEGDWEHITLRFRADSLALDSVYMSQHSGGEWFRNPSQELEWQNGRPVVYSSRNGHASYAHAGTNLSNGFSWKPEGVTVAEVGLRNDTARGRSVDLLGRCRVVSADFLASNPFSKPQWLNYTGRWGKVVDYVDAALSGVGGLVKEAVKAMISKLPEEVSGESGPTGPSRKGNWNPSWSGDDESISPPWLPGNGIVAFHQGYHNNGELWRTFTDGRQWSTDGHVPLGMSSSPSAVMYRGKLYVFHQGYDDCGQLWYRTFDGQSWSGDTQLPYGLSESPSAVVYNDKIYLFYQGMNDCGVLWYAIFDGNSWSKDSGLPVGLSASPAAVVFNGKLYVFHQGGGDSGEFWCITFNGSTWSADTRLPYGLSDSPAAVVYNGKLYLFYEGRGDCGVLWHAVSSDGSSWPQDAGLPIGVTGGPSAVVFENKLHLFHQGKGDNGQLWRAVFDGQTWAPDVQISGVGMSSSPSAVVWSK